MTERQIFETALQITDLEARQVWIDQACAADAVLRDRVKALLAEHAADSQFANSPLGDQSEEPFDPRITGQTSLFPAGGPHVAEAPGANAGQDAEDNDAETTPDLSFLSPSASPGSIGKLGHYEILQVLGQGAFGIVFKAFDEKLHRVVAIKVINPQLAATSPPRKRFLREARSVAAIKHDNIVQVYSVEEHPLPYLVMEYVDGPTLQQKLDGAGPLDLPEILHLGRQMASGLAAAHAQGLIHRDIKPGNILLERGAEQRVKITDFGLARAADDASMTSTGMISGTPMYMAPEQAMGQTLDHRADLFSLGSVLYQMVSGRPPFRGPTAIAVLKRVADEMPRPIPDIISDVPVWLCEIIRKLHAKKPEDRFQSAKEVADLLARCQTKPPTSEEPDSPSRASAVSQTVKPLEAFKDNKPSEQKPPEQLVQNRGINSPTNSKTASPWRWLVPLCVISIGILAFLTNQMNRGAKQTDTELAEASSETSDLKPEAPKKTGWHGWPADAPPPAIAPFDAEQAQHHQEAWAKYLGVPVEYTNSLGMKFRLIPPGEFTMGSTQEEIEEALKFAGDDKLWQDCIRSEAPQHKVILTQPIYLGVNEVTQAEYEKVMGVNPSHFALTGMGKEAVAGLETADHPVETVSWNDAAEFCAKLSKQEKLKPFYFRAGETITPLDGTGYRLPSEAEWEFACRAGTATKYWIGDKNEDLVRAGWFNGNSGGRTRAAGELKANPFGLADIYGNVWEWMQDGWDASYYGQFSEKPAINPNSPFSAGSQRVLRGGNWGSPASVCRSSNRGAYVPPGRHDYVGFRVSLPVDAVRQALKVTGPGMPEPVATTPSAPASDPIDFAAERKAAEWIYQVKGSNLALANAEGSQIYGGKLDGVPLPQEPFVVTHMRLGSCDIDDAGLKNLAGCRRIKELNLDSNSRITTAGLKALPPLRSLKALTLGQIGVDSTFLTTLSQWPNLEVVDLGHCLQLTDQGATSAPRILNLQNLSIQMTRITDKGLETLADRFPNLSTLHIFEDDGENRRTLLPLGRFPKLKTVGCSAPQVTEAGVAVLAEHPQLEHLYLLGRSSDATFERLLPLRGRLKSFTLFTNALTASPPTSRAYSQLAQFSRLEAITLFGLQGSPTDADLTLLAQLPQLKTLGLRFPESSAFPEAPDAKRHYTPDGIAAFRQARPDIELNIDGKQYRSNGWPLAAVKQLDETDPLPKWELPEGSPLPVVAPCSPEEAAALQLKWAEHLKRPVVEEVASPAGLDMKFALIPPGEFRKIFTRSGDTAIEPDMPVRRFRITKSYALSTTEVTWDQFRQFVEATGYQTEAETNGLGGKNREFKPDPKINWRTPGWKPAPNEPVTQVTPRDAEAFCAWLTDPVGWASSPSVPSPLDKKEDAKKEKKKDGLEAHPTVIYRLPTEAEWVHACRAGSVHKHVVGPEPGDLADYAWTKEFLDPNPQASPLHLVAQKKPNPFGLRDTLGNVWEYTQDYFPPAFFPYAQTNNPLGARSTGVLGVSWDGAANGVHSDVCVAPFANPQSNVGFRVLKQFDAEPLPGPLDRPLVLRAGQPLSVHALVPRPEKIPGLQSWSLELASSHGASNAIAVSPKGDVIAMSNGFGKISLWDRDGNYQRALLGHENFVTSLGFSPDGRWLASGDVPSSSKGTMGCTVRIWNVETGSLHALIPSPIHLTRGVKFSPDGKQLAVSTEDQYKTSFFIFDLATGQIRLPTGEQRGRGLAWSPDSTKLASSATDGDGGKPSRLRIWDLATLKVLQDVECPLSASLEWSPDGDWIATRDAEAKVAIRDAKTLAVTKTLGTNALPIAWLPDSKRLVVRQDGSPSGIFDATTGEQLTKIDAAPGGIFDEGKQAVVESNGRLIFYDTSTGQKLREGKPPGAVWAGTTLAPDGREVFASDGNNIGVFDASSGQRLRNFAANHFWPFNTLSVQSLPNSNLTARGGPDGDESILAIIDSQTGLKRHKLLHDKGNVTRVVWSPDGKWLATGATDKLVRVWNVATGKIEHELAGHTGTIWSLAWSPDGTRLASAAEDKTVRLWNPLAGKLVATHDQFPEAIAFHHDNRQNLSWTTDSRRLWIALSSHIVPLDMETGAFGPLENFSNGNLVKFLNTSPNGQRLLAREGAGWTFVRGRDAQDRRLLGQHLGQTAQWHPDSRRFLGWELSYGTVGFDVETNRRLGLLFPWLTGEHWLCLGPTGHYRGSPGVEDQFVYVAMLPDGSQRTYTPAEFAKQFGWKNDPEKAELLGK